MEEKKVNKRAKPQLQLQQSQVLQNMSVCRGMATCTRNMDHFPLLLCVSGWKQEQTDLLGSPHGKKE